MSRNRAKGGRNLAQPANEVQSTTHEGQGTMEQANEVQINEDQSVDQGLAAEAGEAQSTERVAQGATDVVAVIEQAETELPQSEREEPPVDEPAAEGEQPAVEDEAQSTVPKVQTTMGIGQFCRYLMLNSSKSNAEILELVLKHFPSARTTPACIAWYKTDLRKKGLLPTSGGARSAVKTVNLSADELLQLTK